MFKTKLSVGILLLAVLLHQACTPTTKQDIHLQGSTMGTTYNVKYSPSDHIDPKQLQHEVDALLVVVNKLMSTYDPQSELSLFNQYKSTEPYPLSADTLAVMAESLRLGKISQGALDITIGPLIKLWGFDANAKVATKPSRQELIAARELSGLNKLLLLDSEAQKTHPELFVNLSTTAKGFGVDKVAELLLSHGIQDFLVEIGGEMRLSGKKANGVDWQVAIEKPISSKRAVQRLIKIGNNALATSGDYRNYFEQDGVRYSHIIDPRTGFPITHNLVAVTVVHPSSMTADGLATALMVLGKEQALKVAKDHGFDVLLITRENGQFKEYTSGDFEQFIQPFQPE